MQNTKHNSNYQIRFSSGNEKVNFVVSKNKNNVNSIDEIIKSAFHLIESELTKNNTFQISKIEKLKSINLIKFDSKLRQIIALSKILASSIDNDKLQTDISTVSQYYLQAEAITDLMKSVKKMLSNQLDYLDYKL